ncbi:Extracellular membrane protein, CFEM domain protein [Akanthomyces lecanii RCEF 1005]|uniref:Extracellular membrane protein, CFEM domain protein n=1 Tax=Akanthomyces lecanii RCEF 1005 TaxID=1081108 RepID=A0A168HXA7_CORDF|nr:Extracellular membrane protein, CFEM domain protein [Akanthomyces lecanii RCEF 1005]
MVAVEMVALAGAAALATPAPLLLSSIAPRDSSIGTSDFISELPHCATPCVEQFCSLSNQTCICGPDKSAVDHCVLASCTMQEAIFTRNATEITCAAPVRDRRMKFNVMIVAITCVTLPIVTARLVYKQFFSISKRLNTEDWTIVLAILLGLPSVALTIFGLTAHGLGTDLWGLSSADLVAFGRSFYAIQVIYILLMLLVKLTLTFFYLNIFSGHRVRILLWGTIAFHIMAAAAFGIALIFQCLPISYQWNKYNYINDPSLEGHCINVNAGAWANSAVSVASDIWLLAIPLSQLYKLQLHWKKKLGAAIMLFTGVIVTVVSFLRLASVKDYATTSNPTWDQWDIVWWSTIELEVGFICTCLPTMRLILVRMAPKAFGSSQSTNSSYGANMHRLESNSTMHTHREAYDDVTLHDVPLPKRSSAPASSSVERVPKAASQIAVSSLREELSTTGSSIGTKPGDAWQTHASSLMAKHPTTWRGSV